MMHPPVALIFAAVPDLVIYLGPGVGLAIIGFLTFWIRRQRSSRPPDAKLPR
jgi:hypothetical protein